MKNIIIALVGILFLAGCSKSSFPKEISPSAMVVITNTSGDEGDFFRVYGQYLQRENGEFPTEFDKVLITKIKDKYKIGFYRNLGDKFTLISKPVTVADTYSPRASANEEFNVPCILAIKKDGTQTNQVFISKGKLIQK